MKSFHALVALIFILQNSSCRGDLREAEPQNNQRETAQLLPSGATVKGTWYSPQGRDIDCYQYHTSEPRMVRGTLSGVKGVDPEIYLYADGAAEPFKIINDGLSSLGENFGPLLVHPPRLLICLQPVHQINQPEYRSLEYEFSATLFQPPRFVEQEPNDLPAQANSLENTIVLGYYSTGLSGRDERGVELLERDFFVLDFPDDKRYRIKIELTGVSGIDPILRLHDSSGSEIRLIDERGQNQGEILPSYGFQGPGQAYISITAKDRKINMQEYYELKVTNSEYENNYEFEPNDRFDKASTLSEEKTYGELADAGDVDIFQLKNQAEYPRQYSILVRSEAKVNLQLETFFAERQRRNIFNDAGVGAPEGIANLQLSSEESIYLKVSAVDSSSGFPAPYVIEMAYAPPVDFTETEPNDSVRQANDILTDSTMIGYINPNADIDVYRTANETRQTFKILLDGIPGCRLLLRIADKTGAVYEKREGRSDGEGISFTGDLEPKSYLMVSCARANENLFRRPYKLTLQGR